MIANNEAIPYRDDGNANEVDRSIFMAIRSNYLAWRLGDEFVIEPYSPHRFSRQFGYYQIPPGILKKDVRRAGFDDDIQYWRACLLQKSYSRATIPSSLQNAKKLYSLAYKNWWHKVYGEFLEKNFAVLTQLQEQDASKDCGEDTRVTLTPLENTRKRKASLDEPSNVKRKSSPIPLDVSLSSNVDPYRHSRVDSIKDASIEDDADHAYNTTLEMEKALGIDNLEDSQSSHRSCGSSQSLGTHHSNGQATAKQAPQIGAKSEFNSEAIFSDRCRKFLELCWGDLQAKIMRTSVDDLSSIEDGIRKGMSYMKDYSRDFDVSHLEESLDILFARAGDYDKTRSASHDLGGSAAQRLKEAERKFHDASAEASKQAAQIDSIKQEIATLSSNLKQLQAANQATQNKVHDLKEEFVKLKNAPPMDDEMAKSLQDSKTCLEAAQQSLKDQKPFA